MTKFTRVNSDSVDALKSPLIPALLFMTMTSFTPSNCTINFVGPTHDIARGTTAPSLSKEGLSLFMKEELEKRSKNHSKIGKLAKAKGIALPQTISTLPDETVDFLATQGITPDFVNSTTDGSLMIEFQSNGHYHMAEFWPDGDIVFLKKGDNGTDIWDLTGDNYFDKFKEALLIEPQFESVE